jgi:hypothetical protein
MQHSSTGRIANQCSATRRHFNSEVRSAVIALRQDGREPRVFEQAPRRREAGAGELLTPNGVRVRLTPSSVTIKQFVSVVGMEREDRRADYGGSLLPGFR